MTSQASASPHALLDRARETLADVYAPTRHRTACALSTTAGNVHTGIHLATTIGTAAVHAEAAAIANACEYDDSTVDCIVSVSHVVEDHDEPVPREDVRSAAVIPPCGSCRELVYEYGPNASVVVSASPELEARPIAELLPDAPWYTGW